MKNQKKYSIFLFLFAVIIINAKISTTNKIIKVKYDSNNNKTLREKFFNNQIFYINPNEKVTDKNYYKGKIEVNQCKGLSEQICKKITNCEYCVQNKTCYSNLLTHRIQEDKNFTMKSDFNLKCLSLNHLLDVQEIIKNKGIILEDQELDDEKISVIVG